MVSFDTTDYLLYLLCPRPSCCAKVAFPSKLVAALVDSRIVLSNSMIDHFSLDLFQIYLLNPLPEDS